MSLKGLDQNIWNKFDRGLYYIWRETCRVVKMPISHLFLRFLRLKMFRKFPEAFVEEGSCRAPSAFPKLPPSEGSCHQRPELEGYWIFLIIVRSDHWPAWRSPCHRRSRSSQVTRPRWLRGGRRPEMPALIAGPTLCGNVIGWFIKTQVWMSMRLSTVSLSEKVKY